MSTINIVEPQATKVLQVRRETNQEVTFRVESSQTPIHGQFLQLSLPKIGEVPISISAFGPGWMEFTVRAVGRVTDKLFALQPGDVLFTRGAYGNGWPMDTLRYQHLVVIAGGTGLAPVRSLLQLALQDKDFFYSVTLIVGFRNAESVLFRAELEQCRQAKNFKVITTLDNEDLPGFEKGFVTAHLDKIPFAEMDGDVQVIVVGPPAMMHHTAQGCLNLKVPERKIWLSFERRMSCAVGKCGHCRIDEVYVCQNGPVFNYTQAKTLVD